MKLKMSKKKKKVNIEETKKETENITESSNIATIITDNDENSLKENSTTDLETAVEENKGYTVENNSENFIEDNKSDNTEDNLDIVEGSKQNNATLENVIPTTSQETITKTENPIPSKKTNKTFVIVSICFLTIFILLLLFSTVFALSLKNSPSIINGISINNIDVSGLTKQQALEKVSNIVNAKLTKAITLKHNEYELSIFLNQFDVSFDIENAINIAYNKGRERKYF